MKPRDRRVPYRPDEEEWTRTPDAARRLDVRIRGVYRLDEGVFRNALDDERHRAWVPVADVEAYLGRRSA
jgi:hypothetical protein